ncbi:hypothetical protein M2432_003907 [Mycobacterium sp. OTB74]|nr:hypothetical protein [Mycobacterium sp. OTB74]
MTRVTPVNYAIPFENRCHTEILGRQLTPHNRVIRTVRSTFQVPYDALTEPMTEKFAFSMRPPRCLDRPRKR